MNVIRSITQVQRGTVMGALGAALLGGFFALEFDRLAALAAHLMQPLGQRALIQALGIAGLVGLVGSAASVMLFTVISRHVLRPYLILTDQLEGLTGGTPHDVLMAAHQPRDSLRLARAILSLQTTLATNRGATDVLQSRYDALCDANTQERQSLMAILIENATGQVATVIVPSALMVAPSDPFLVLHPPMPALLDPPKIAPIAHDDLGPLRLVSHHGHVTAH